MYRLHQVRWWVRRMLLIGVGGILPALVMRCDKALLNVQEGFFEGLGAALSSPIAEAGLFTVGGA